MVDSTALTIIEEVNKRTLQVLNSENFPLEVQKGISDILTIVNNNQTLPDLYGRILQEIPVSTSIFQDICVQMSEHHTPHRKLRQVMLELGGKLDALDAAKNGHRKAIVKIEKLNDEIRELQDLYNQLNESNASLSFEMCLKLSALNYQTKEGEHSITHELIPNAVVSSAMIHDISEPSFIKLIANKIKAAAANKIVDLEEAERGLKSSEHMIKDAALKAAQLQAQVVGYQKEVEESGLSFEEAEVVYYTMFFTSDAERQLRTGDHQIDRGTYGAISQLPTPIRKKVISNIAWLEKKIRDDFDQSGSWFTQDYYFKTYREILEPKKTGDGEFEGMSVRDFEKMEPIKILSRPEG